MATKDTVKGDTIVIDGTTPGGMLVIEGGVVLADESVTGQEERRSRLLPPFSLTDLTGWVATLSRIASGTPVTLKTATGERILDRARHDHEAPLGRKPAAVKTPGTYGDAYPITLATVEYLLTNGGLSTAINNSIRVQLHPLSDAAKVAAKKAAGKTKEAKAINLDRF